MNESYSFLYHIFVFGQSRNISAFFLIRRSLPIGIPACWKAMLQLKFLLISIMMTKWPLDGEVGRACHLRVRTWLTYRVNFVVSGSSQLRSNINIKTAWMLLYHLNPVGVENFNVRRMEMRLSVGRSSNKVCPMC